jgi:hemolysin-activating ACP:hemolysin acyltransferase
VELYRAKDNSLNQPLVYRLFGLGNLTLFTSDRTHPVFTLWAIRDPEKKYQFLREQVERNRKEKRVFEVD